MGCTQSSQVHDTLQIQLKQSPVGILRITLQNSLVTNYDSMMSTMDVYAIIKLSNKTYETSLKSRMDKASEVPFNETFLFVINKTNVNIGRVIQFEIWDKFKIGKNQIGYALLDLDKLVRLKLQDYSPTPASKISSLLKQQVRYKCWLNRQNVVAGFINIVASFEQVPHQVVFFRFQTAVIRKKKLIGNMNCAVRVIIGQQQLQTKRSQDTKQRPPSWLQDTNIMKFKIPKSQILKQYKCIINLLDNDQIVGQILMDINQIINVQVNKQIKFVEQCYLNEEHTGSLKYSIYRGEIAHFQNKLMMGSKIVKKQHNNSISVPQQQSIIKQKDNQKNKQKEKQNEKQKEKLEKQKQKQREKEKEKQKEKEKEKEMQKERERQKERLKEIQKEKQKERQNQKQKQKQRQRLKQIQLQKQKQLQKERERQRQRQKSREIQKQKEKQRQKEIQRLKQIQQQNQIQVQKQKQKEKEKQKQKQNYQQMQRQKKFKQLQNERQRLQQQQKEKERQNQIKKQKQKEKLENQKQQQKQIKTENEKQKQIVQQKIKQNNQNQLKNNQQKVKQTKLVESLNNQISNQDS